MALANHLLTAWVWQGTAADKAVGFVTMTKAEFDAAKAEGRAQDPRVGALHLKPITRALFVPAPPPEGTPATAPARRGRPSTKFVQAEG